jgi:tetratricopeptide (TPR) repeat protein
MNAKALKEDGKADDLLQMASKRLESNPDEPLANAYLGYALALKGQKDEALLALAKASKDAQEGLPTILLRSRLLHEMEREADSVALLDDAMDTIGVTAVTMRAVIAAHISANRPLAALKVAHRLIEVAPQEADSWRSLCETAMGVGHYAEAVEAAGKVLLMAPDDSVTARYQALSLSRLGFTEQAIRELKSHLDTHPTDRDGWHDLGLLQARKGSVDEAIKSFHKALDLDERDFSSCLSLGTALAKSEKFADSLEVLRKAVEINEHSTEAWYNMGVALERLGRGIEALDAYDKALMHGEEAPPADAPEGTAPKQHLATSINRGVLLAKMGRVEEARAQLEKALESDAHNTALLFNLASVYYVQDEYQKAYLGFKRLLHHDPFDVEGWKLRGSALARSLGIDEKDVGSWMAKGEELFAKRSYVEAHECFRRASELDPKHVTPRTRRAQTLAAVYQIRPDDPAAWLRTSRMLVELRLLSDAMDALAILFSLKPHDPDGRILVGRILFSIGRYSHAVAQADIALKQNPKHSGAMALKGEALLNQGQPAEAIVSFDNLLALTPQDPIALTLKGIALCKLGRGNEGIQVFDEALKLDPRHREAWYQKGMELERQGHYSSAVEAFTQGFR